MSLFDRYKDEAEFRDNFVRPMLNGLGLFHVSQLHGSQEFGKDFVFSELHRLGGVRHYAAQVKHEERISQGKSVDGLLSQIRQAFATSFRRADSIRECHVSAVYVFNSGQITDNAKTQMLDDLGRERYGDNVHFLDGERLLALNQWATLQDDRQLRARLVGLVTTLTLNLLILKSYVAQDLTQPKESRGFIFTAFETYLTSPLPFPEIEINDVSLLWQQYRIAQSCGDSWVGFTSDATKSNNHEVLKSLVPSIEELSLRVGRGANALLARLQPIQ